MRALVCLLLLTSQARAQDNFEIQVYDAETAKKNDAGGELHINVFAGNAVDLWMDDLIVSTTRVGCAP